jgi:hypothetical protein
VSKPLLKEIDIQRQCSDFLALDGWRMLRTDPCSDRRLGKGFGEIGMADCLYLRYGYLGYMNTAAEVIWIEWKRPGGKLMPKQIQWHRAERSRGAITFIAGVDFPADFGGFLAWYRASGLLRRPGL